MNPNITETPIEHAIKFIEKYKIKYESVISNSKILDIYFQDHYYNSKNRKQIRKYIEAHSSAISDIILPKSNLIGETSKEEYIKILRDDDYHSEDNEDIVKNTNKTEIKKDQQIQQLNKQISQLISENQELKNKEMNQQKYKKKITKLQNTLTSKNNTIKQQEYKQYQLQESFNNLLNTYNMVIYNYQQIQQFCPQGYYQQPYPQEYYQQPSYNTT
jgi:DNA repair exonuclease SbcCD ATPase subunit